MHQGRNMENLPQALVETWLQLAVDTREENKQASQMATNNLIKVFGNLTVAKAYVNQLESVD